MIPVEVIIVAIVAIACVCVVVGVVALVFGRKAAGRLGKDGAEGKIGDWVYDTVFTSDKDESIKNG